jgi:hypothetical protein
MFYKFAHLKARSSKGRLGRDRISNLFETSGVAHIYVPIFVNATSATLFSILTATP